MVFRCQQASIVAANNEQSLEESQSLHARNLIFTNLYGYIRRNTIVDIKI